MRRWLALLIGIAAVAFAGTALALTGSLENADYGQATTTTMVEVEATTEVVLASSAVEPQVELESIPDLMVEEELVDALKHHDEPIDDTPPLVEILYPEDGQVFEHREVVVEGITEPGARVFTGDHEAEVSEEGAWRMVLNLEWGENVITVTALDDHENSATDSVKVIAREPEKPKEERKEEPKEEPKEEHREEVQEWAFTAHQTYGECSESPPYEVFFGTGKPGSRIVVESEFGRKTTEVGDHGKWEIKVIFEGAPVGEVFAVHVADEFGNHEVFEFVHTG